MQKIIRLGERGPKSLVVSVLFGENCLSLGKGYLNVHVLTFNLCGNHCFTPNIPFPKEKWWSVKKQLPEYAQFYK
jgi:hypothetical protein